MKSPNLIFKMNLKHLPVSVLYINNTCQFLRQYFISFAVLPPLPTHLLCFLYCSLNGITTTFISFALLSISKFGKSYVLDDVRGIFLKI